MPFRLLPLHSLLEGSFHSRGPVFFDDIVTRHVVCWCGASCSPCAVTSSVSRVVRILSRWRASGTRGTRVAHALERTLLVLRVDSQVAVGHAQRVGGMPSALHSARISEAREFLCRQPSLAIFDRLPIVKLRPRLIPRRHRTDANTVVPQRKVSFPLPPGLLTQITPVQWR